MTKLLVITDFDFQHSGYKNIAEKLLDEMALKDYEIKVLGLAYKGQEHNHNYSILPANNIYDIAQMAVNLDAYWKPDILLVMLDIPLQMHFFNALSSYQTRYIAITPLENGPLTMSWAAGLISLPAVLFISELGRDEAVKAGLTNADYIQIGIDSQNEWRLPTPDEKSKIREGLGFDEDTFIILTVADNQERKNLWAAMYAVEKLKRNVPYHIKLRHIIVTREDSEVGWRLKDLALTMGMVQELVIYQRGMPQRDLWSLYAAADAFLLTSKAEGLGLPILDAFATGVPVVGTDTGAIHELLKDDRGALIPHEYTFIDVWGNSKRDMIDVEEAFKALRSILFGVNNKNAARRYVETRTWSVAAGKLHETIEKVLHEKA